MLEISEQEGEPPSKRILSWNHPNYSEEGYVDEEYGAIVRRIYNSQTEEDRDIDRQIERENYEFKQSLLATEPIDRSYYEKESMHRRRRLFRRLAHTIDLLEHAASTY